MAACCLLIRSEAAVPPDFTVPVLAVFAKWQS
jgi:hypothetical protein